MYEMKVWWKTIHFQLVGRHLRLKMVLCTTAGQMERQHGKLHGRLCYVIDLRVEFSTVVRSFVRISDFYMMNTRPSLDYD